MPTPALHGTKRRQPDFPPPQTSTSTNKSSKPTPAPANKRLHPALSKPFKSPLKSASGARSGPAAPGPDATSARANDAPSTNAHRKALHADISILEQALHLLYPASLSPSPTAAAASSAHSQPPPKSDPPSTAQDTRTQDTGHPLELDAHGLPLPPADRRLDTLTAKWRGAARAAAELVHRDMAARVEAAGGLGAMRRRAREVAEEPFAAPLAGRGSYGEVEGRECGDVDCAREDCDGEGEGAEEEDDDEGGFTLGKMLDTMHVEHAILGWDEAELAWTE